MHPHEDADAQRLNCLVTNEPTHSYFGCPGWTAYKMEAGKRATFYLDYDHDEIMVYYNPAGSNDDGPLTPHYDVDSACHNVELAS
ncbi:hypothetical protein D1007_34253 [Hordeum vulgare]|nr:hypothetical protein D1007_34253 [Hordeum vulgare]